MIDSAAHLSPLIQRKAGGRRCCWARVAARPALRRYRAKRRWRRTPVQGNHYYMWWIPRSETTVSALLATGRLNGSHTGAENGAGDANSILVHSIRHHDETDEPIDVGTLADYEEVAVSALDPRFDEQTAVSRKLTSEQVSLATVKGMPGSGKTISLFYLVERPSATSRHPQNPLRNLHPRLKRAAREFLQAQGEELSQRVRILTFSEIETEIVRRVTASDPFAELRDFTRFLEAQPPNTLGAWRRYPQTLLPKSVLTCWVANFRRAMSCQNSALTLALSKGRATAGAYAADRGLRPHVAEQAWKIAERTRDRFFHDQEAASRALETLMKGRPPRWLMELDALIIDEVQDLTLVQIAMLGEIVRQRLRKKPDAPFYFTVAGDESADCSTQRL